MSNETIGLILVRANKITRVQLYEALREQRATGNRLGDILYARGWIGDEELALLLARQLDLDYVEPAALDAVPASFAEKFPKNVAVDYHVVPVRLAKGKLVVAMEEHKTRHYMDEIGYLLGQTCVPAIASPRSVRSTIRRLYGVDLPPPMPPVPRKIEKHEAPAHRAPAIESVRPPEKLEALPEVKIDAKGRDVIAAKNAAGEDVVYLLTDVSGNTPAGGSPVVRPAEQLGASRPVSSDDPALLRYAGSEELVEVAESDSTGKHKAMPKPATAPPKPAGGEPDRHDNFLAPDLADDDRPMLKPKIVTGSEKPKPAPQPPAPPKGGGEQFDIVRAAEKLFEATSPEGIGEVVVGFCRHLVDRAFLFDVTGPRYKVLARGGAFPDDDRGVGFIAPAEDLVLLSVIAQTQQPAYGPTPSGDMYQKFFDTMGLLKPPVILLYPLVVTKKTRAVLYGGLGKMRPPDEFGDLQLLFKEAATALELLRP
jgi:hypothetical protein